MKIKYFFGVLVVLLFPLALFAQELSPEKEKAQSYCEEKKGLSPGSEDYKRCMRGVHHRQQRGNYWRQASPEKQAAIKHCEGKGLDPGTPAFKSCLKHYKKARQ